ncbi:MAG TPA: SWIM zinc finger family protein [Chloroflexia bacterium]|nr:SWIM zinc finger family protein [Chloroflexia bacterium]
MTTTWTTEQILNLAPDPASAKAGKELATRRKWVTLGTSEAALWGECQGSAKTPYQTQLDLSGEVAFKCSCPSRKLPCKHSLGLFLLYEKEPQSFEQLEPPQWVSAWLQARQQRSEQQAKKREQKPKNGEVSDPAAQARRAAERLARAQAGVQDFKLWLADLLRQGLAGAQLQSYQFWDKPAARLVDAQLPGLARQVRALAGIPVSGKGWQSRLLERLGKIHLQLEGFQRLESLPETLQADLRGLLGWTQNQDELLAQSGLRDFWSVVGQTVEEQERLRVRRTWLWGRECGKTALLLHFAHNTQPFEINLLPGSSFEAEIVYFPGSFPVRALIRQQYGPFMPYCQALKGTLIETALQDYAEALSVNPWLEELPVMLQAVVPARAGAEWYLRDEAGSNLPVNPGFSQAWNLLALSGGKPLTVFGLWNGSYFSPSSAVTEGHFVNFNGTNQSATSNSLAENQAWQEILTAALVGTARQTPKPSGLSGSPGEALAKLDRSNPDRYLLGAAALLSQYERSGQLPAPDSLPLPEVSPQEILPRCSERAGSDLRQIMEGSYRALLPEWLANLVASKQRLPEERLPELFELGRQQTELQPLILAGMGRRGSWLAAQNAQWNYINSYAQAEAAGIADWDTGEQAVRLLFLQKLRSTEPDRARVLLQATWNSEKAEDRAAFLARLKTGLSLEDEPFLETALDDRSREVRRVAAGLLASLPQSALSQRMLKRLEGHLFLRKQLWNYRLEVELPAAFDPEMERDGIDPKPKANLGDKAGWFVQMLALIPPKVWVEKFGQPANKLLEEALDGDWFELLLEGWQQAALFHADTVWAEALWDFISKKPLKNKTFALDVRLAELLSPERREQLALQLLKQYGTLYRDHPARKLLMACATPWSLELTREVLKSLSARIAENPGSWDYFLPTIFNEIGPYLNPEIAGETSQIWPTNARAWNYVANSVTYLETLLQFRQEMLKALDDKNRR